MKRIMSLSVLAVFFLALSALSLTIVRQTNGAIDQEGFDAVKLGMTSADIERVLGGSPRIECSEQAVFWVPSKYGLKSAEFGAGKPMPQFFSGEPDAGNSQQWVWAGKQGLIAARFGDDGLLQDKYFSTVHDPGRPGVWSWLSQKSAELVGRSR